MSLDLSREEFAGVDPLDRVEEALEIAGWQHERDEEGTIQAVAETRWGDMGALFAFRPEPAAIHFSVTLDVKPVAAKRSQLSELIIMANERLWLGHFDYWADEGVVIFKILRNAADAAYRGKVCIVRRNPDAIWFDDYEDRVIYDEAGLFDYKRVEKTNDEK